ncbi:MAG: hypothetical protein R6V83_10550 [Candidatus Thorarchaeota archaeon]
MEDLATQTLHLHNDSMKVRPSVVETSDWDRDDVRFSIWWTGNQVKPPGSIRRHQVIRGKSVTIDLDWENALAGYNKVYASIKVKTSKELSQDFWINRTISSSEDKITVDLSRLTSDDTGLPLWVSHGSDYISPVILVRLYQENPLRTDFWEEPIRRAEDENRWRIEFKKIRTAGERYCSRWPFIASTDRTTWSVLESVSLY